MDDLFQILIYLIIIISFLSSLFKKKTPEAPPQQKRRVPQDHIPEAKPQQTQQVEDYDILREIENMFKTEAEKKPETQKKTTKIEEAARTMESKIPSERVSYEDLVTAQSSEQYRDVSEKQVTRSEQQVTKSEHQYRIYEKKPAKIDKKTEERAKKFEELLQRRGAHEEELRDELVRKIKNPATFREFILVAEILGKPKALRR